MIQHLLLYHQHFSLHQVLFVTGACIRTLMRYIFNQIRTSTVKCGSPFVVELKIRHGIETKDTFSLFHHGSLQSTSGGAKTDNTDKAHSLKLRKSFRTVPRCKRCCHDNECLLPIMLRFEMEAFTSPNDKEWSDSWKLKTESYVNYCFYTFNGTPNTNWFEDVQHVGYLNPEEVMWGYL